MKLTCNILVHNSWVVLILVRNKVRVVLKKIVDMSPGVRPQELGVQVSHLDQRHHQLDSQVVHKVS